MMLPAFRTTAMITLRRIAPVVLPLALAGCINLGLGSAKVPPALLTLTPAHGPADGMTASGRPDHALTVTEPLAEARLAVVRVPVTVDASRVAYLKGAQWVERPSRLFQHLMAETLRARDKRLVVEGDSGGHGPTLGGRLIDFGYDATARAAVVRFDATRSQDDGTIATRRFEATVPGVAPEANAVGHALNDAANQVAGAVADWMS